MTVPDQTECYPATRPVTRGEPSVLKRTGGCRCRLRVALIRGELEDRGANRQSKLVLTGVPATTVATIKTPGLIAPGTYAVTVAGSLLGLPVRTTVFQLTVN